MYPKHRLVPLNYTDPSGLFKCGSCAIRAQHEVWWPKARPCGAAQDLPPDRASTHGRSGNCLAGRVRCRSHYARTGVVRGGFGRRAWWKREYRTVTMAMTSGWSDVAGVISGIFDERERPGSAHAAGSFGARGVIGRQRRIATISRYSLGATKSPSTDRLACAIMSSSSFSSLPCPAVPSASNARFMGP